MAQYQITLDQEIVQGIFQQDGGLAKLVEQVLNQILEAQVGDHLWWRRSSLSFGELFALSGVAGLSKRGARRYRRTRGSMACGNVVRCVREVIGEQLKCMPSHPRRGRPGVANGVKFGGNQPTRLRSFSGCCSRTWPSAMASITQSARPTRIFIFSRPRIVCSSKPKETSSRLFTRSTAARSL